MASKSLTSAVATAAEWQAGTLEGAEVFADDALSIATVPAIRMLGDCSGGANPYAYRDILQDTYAPSVGDVLIYEQFIDPMTPDTETYLDGPISGGPRAELRSYNPIDHNGYNLRIRNGDADESAYRALAFGRWYERRFSLDQIANDGATFTAFTLALEGDSAGRHEVFYRKVRIEDSAGNLKKTIYDTTLLYTGTSASTGGVNLYANVEIREQNAYIAATHERTLDLSPIGRYVASEVRSQGNGGIWFNGRKAQAASSFPSRSGPATLECCVLLDFADPPETTGTNVGIADLGSWGSTNSPTAGGFGIWYKLDGTTDDLKITVRDSGVNCLPYSSVKLDRIGTTRVPKWLSAVYDGTDIRLYVDGVLAKTIANATVYAWDKLTLGRRIDTTVEYMRGTVGEVREWDHARTEQQITDNLFRRLTGSETGLVAYYPFDDDADVTVAKDRAGSNDLTVQDAGRVTYSLEAAVSLDNGASWGAPVVLGPGDPIPGLAADQDCRGVLVKLTTRLRSLHPFATPAVQSTTVSAEGTRAVLRYWDGAQWLEKPVKAYDGAQWLTTDPRVYVDGRWL